MTLTTLPEHLKPMVEKAAEDRADWLVDAVAGSTQNRMFLRGEKECDEVACEAIKLNGQKAIEVAILAFLNACLDSGVAAEADGFNRIDGMEADSTSRPDGATFDFRALILNLGEAK